MVVYMVRSFFESHLSQFLKPPLPWFLKIFHDIQMAAIRNFPHLPWNCSFSTYNLLSTMRHHTIQHIVDNEKSCHNPVLQNYKWPPPRKMFNLTKEIICWIRRQITLREQFESLCYFIPDIFLFLFLLRCHYEEILCKHKYVLYLQISI